MSTPAKNQFPGAVTRFDELVSSNQIQGLLIHSTGVFLPYHRYLLHIHETFLRECNYTGVIPYVSSRARQQLERPPALTDDTDIGTRQKMLEN